MLLQQSFPRLQLNDKDRDELVSLYEKHLMPLPQRISSRPEKKHYPPENGLQTMNNGNQRLQPDNIDIDSDEPKEPTRIKLDRHSSANGLKRTNETVSIYRLAGLILTVIINFLFSLTEFQEYFKCAKTDEDYLAIAGQVLTLRRLYKCSLTTRP